MYGIVGDLRGSNKKLIIVVALLVLGAILMSVGASILFYTFYEQVGEALNITEDNQAERVFTVSKAVYKGTVVSVENGIVKSFDGRSLRIRATGLNLKIHVVSDKDSLNVEVENVKAGSIGTIAQDIVIKTKDPHTIGFTIPFLSSDTADVELYPADNPYDFSFIVLGDSRDGPSVFMAIVSDINQKRPLFAIDNGDLVSEGTKGEYTEFASMLEQVDVPFFTVIGNHDIRNNGRSEYERLFGPSYYAFSYGNSRFIIVDTSEEGIGEAQLRWLEDELRNNRAPNLFVFTHVPPVDPRPGGDHSFKDPGQRDMFFDLMTRYRVDRVYASHVHGFYRFEKGGVQYIVTGGAGAPLISSDSYNHYVLVTVDDTDISEQIIKVKEPAASKKSRYINRSNLLKVKTELIAGIFLAAGCGLILVAFSFHHFLKQNTG